MNFIQVQFEVDSEAQAEIISALLEETGFIGSELQEQTLNICYDETSFDEQLLQEICEPQQWSYTKSIIPQQNWNQQWESNFKPIQIGSDILVRASFHPSSPNFPYELVITPKMSFGTGHHATTQMMLRAMLDIDCNGMDVLDYGCGTGVLGIFACKRGAQRVIGIDIDDWCIENSEENARLNQVSMELQLGNIDRVQGSFDLILANINLNILLENMARMSEHLKPGGQLLLSGLLESDLKSILQGTEQEKLIPVYQDVLNGWMCLKLTKPA